MSILMEDNLDGSFTLIHDLTVTYKSYRIVVPGGFRTDYNSVPWYGRWIVPKVGRNNKAAIVHDWLLKVREVTSMGTGKSIKVSREWCDRVWYEVSKESGMRWVRRTIGYTALRIYTFFRG